MPGLVIFFTVTIAVILPINVVDSKPSQTLDDIIQGLLNPPKNRAIQKGKNRYLDTSDSDYYSDSDSDSDSDYDESDIDWSRYGRLRPKDIMDLIGQAKRFKNKRKDEGITRKNHKKTFGNQMDGYENSNIQTSILEQLFAKGVSKVQPKKKPLGGRPKKRLEPNTLLPFKLNDDDGDHVSGLEDYSKIFVVLNPSSISKGSDRDSLNDLVSKMLSQHSASSKKDTQSKSKQPRYKGFVIKEDLWSRRARRESKEMYAPKDSIEDDYKQKRSRNDRGGGGGGGGRTAIPYIRHRGDIYERDN